MDNPSGDKRPKTNSTMFNKYSLNKAFAPNEPHSDSDASDTDAMLAIIKIYRIYIYNISYIFNIHIYFCNFKLKLL